MPTLRAKDPNRIGIKQIRLRKIKNSVKLEIAPRHSSCAFLDFEVTHYHGLMNFMKLKI